MLLRLILSRRFPETLFEHVSLLFYTYPEAPAAPENPLHESLGYLGHSERRVTKVRELRHAARQYWRATCVA